MNKKKILDSLFSSSIGFSLNKIITNENNQPCDYIFLEINPAYEDITGLKKEDIINRKASKTVLGKKNDFFDLISFYGNFALNGGNKVYKYYSANLNKEYLVQITSEGDGFFSLFYTQSAPSSLPDNEKRFRVFVENSKDIIFSLSPDGIFEYVSPGWKDNLGTEPEEAEGKSFEDFVHKNDISRCRKFLEIVTNEGLKQKNIEYRVKHKDGSWRWHTSTGAPVKDDNGKVVSFLGIARDTTKQKQIREDLENITEQFELAVRGSNDGIWDWDLRDNSLYLSPKWKEQLGYSDNEIQNRFSVFENLIHPDDRLKVNSEIVKYLEGEIRYYDIVFRMIHKNGSEIWIRARGEALRDSLGMPYRMAGSHTDITKHVRTENELIKSNRRLNESIEKAKILAEKAKMASSAKSEFLANMSHEIRTPLNAVIGFTELLMKTSADEIQQQYINNINISGKALLEIINDILDFSKIEAGKLEIDITETDIVTLLEETADIIKFHASEKDLELILNLPPDMPEIAQVDPVRLKQILLNLLNNAVKFTNRGYVELEVKFEQIDKTKGRYEFYAKDTGIGIKQEQKSKIFQAFSQADTSTTRKFGGTGLGLIISNMLAEKMGSKIEFDSTPGKGSVFYFSIETGFKFIEKKEKQDIQINHVLIIDENKKTRDVIKNLFKYLNIEAINCSDETEAEKLIKENNFDFIMQNCSGQFSKETDILKKLKKLISIIPEAQKIVLMINSSNNYNLISQAENIGIKHTITKPVAKNNLLKLIKNIKTGTTSKESDRLHQYDSALTNPHDFRFIKKTILIAEDISMNMDIIKASVRRFIPDSLIIEASDGKKAVEAAKNKDISLIFMDLQMPEMDGIKASQKIRKLEKEKGIFVPIIALTAGVLKEEKEKALKAGMDDFLTKPVDTEKLQEILYKYLSTQRPNSENRPEEYNSSQHFDLKELMNTIGNDTDLKNKLIKNCRSDIPETIEKIENLLNEKMTAGVINSAHLLRGQAANMRLKKLSEFAEKIEAEAKNNNLESALEFAGLLKNEWEIIQELPEFQVS
ncbi:MAG: PAS domain S-box protein [Thermodesulfobacteriota bacterium]